VPSLDPACAASTAAGAASAVIEARKKMMRRICGQSIALDRDPRERGS
jgi:hypothetical protein